jgi:hypothetical protein
MKKIVSITTLLLMGLSSYALSDTCNAACMQNSSFTTAFSSGYVFKRDHAFNQVYGPGAGNIITADFTYSLCRPWAIGGKISYWLASGHTTFFKHRTIMHEVPITFYVRKFHDFRRGLRLYASLGGGFIWIGEQSYLGSSSQVRGIGEAEIGFSYPVGRCLNCTSAFRYLFPRQNQGTAKVDVGGLDLRGGIGISF